MKEKIFQFLKTKLNGVQESYLRGVAEEYGKTITEEAQIETVLTAGVIDAIKVSANHLQTEGDRRATAAANTALENFRKKHNLDENGKPIETPNPPNPNDVATIVANAVNAAIKPLQERVEGFEKSKVKGDLTAKVKAKLAEKNVPDSYLKGRSLDVESEDKIDQLVAGIEQDYTAFRQDLVNQGVVVEVPKGGDGKGDKSNIDDYLKDKFPGTEPKK